MLHQMRQYGDECLIVNVSQVTLGALAPQRESASQVRADGHGAAAGSIVERVPALPPAPLDEDEPRVEQSLQVAGHRRPAAFEAFGERARRHRATPRVQDEQHVPAGLVRQRAEDGIDVVELGEPRRTGQVSTSGAAKCGNSRPGRPSRDSHSASMRSQMGPIFGCWLARRDASSSIHSKIAMTSAIRAVLLVTDVHVLGRVGRRGRRPGRPAVLADQLERARRRRRHEVGSDR